MSKNKHISNYIEQQRAEVETEIQRIRESKNLHAESKRLWPELEKQINEWKQWYIEQCVQLQKENAEKIAAESLAQSLQLEPLLLDPQGTTPKQAKMNIAACAIGGMLACAGIIYAIGFLGAILLPFPWLGAVFLYKKYLSKAREIYEAKKGLPFHQRMERIKKYDISLVQFAPQGADHFTFDYNCTHIVPGREKQMMQMWQLDKDTYGNLHNATFVSFREKEDALQEMMLIKLPFNGHKLEMLELQKGILPSFKDLQEALLQHATEKTHDIVSAITPLTQAITQWRTRGKQEKLLQTKIDYLNAQEEELQKIALPPQTIDELLFQIESFKQGGNSAPRGILLYGPTGTGKSIVPRSLSIATACNYIELNLAELRSAEKHQRPALILELWKNAKLRAPCILFVDDSDKIFNTRQYSPDAIESLQEAMEAFVVQWDAIQREPGKIIVMGATNQKELIDISVLSRFNQSIEITLPNAQAREHIIAQEFEKGGIDAQVSTLMVNETAGMSGRDISSVALRLKGMLASQTMSDELFKNTVVAIRSKASTITAHVEWDNVVLPEELKKKLQYLAKKIKQVEQYKQVGLQISKSLLLYGPPGTGKTQIARALASQSGLAFLAVTTADIKSDKPGEAGKYIQQLFQKARSQSPCLLFIDEIDIVTARRDGADSTSQETVGQFLQEMDGINSRDSNGQVFVIGATNCKDDIDDAVLSRFSDKEEVGLPTLEGRAAILKVNLIAKPYLFDLDELTMHIAQQTESLSGRDLLALVNAAASNAMIRADEQQLDISDIKLIESDFNGVQINNIKIQLPVLDVEL